MSEHPLSWIGVTLGDLLRFNYGKSLPERARSGAGFPVYGSNGIVGYHDEPLTDGETLIIGRKGSVGEVHFSPGACFPIDTTYYVDQFHGMPTRYWFYQLKNLGLSELDKATAIPSLNRKDAYRVQIHLSPLNEQKRIADKLDALLARVDACRDRLIRVSFIIQQLRQAILTDGISGKITQYWSKNNAENLAYNHQNIVGKLSDFADVIDPNPSHRYPSYKGGTIPILATEQMSGLNDWDTSSAKLIKYDFYEARKAAHDFLNDDIIFARKGRLGLARNPPQNIRYVFSHTVFIIRVKADNILPSYLLWFLRQEFCIDWLLSEMNSNAGVPTLGKSVMERLPITIPDYAEQQEIVQCIEKLYAYADRIEARYQNALTRVEQLTPTLLSKAFRGELVPQDPDDEPVSVLLERIRAERAAQPNKPKRVVNRSKSNMTKISSQSLTKLIHQLPNNTFSFDELYSDINKKMSGDYDSIKDILFTLLDESEPSIIQIFDSETKAMRFMRRYQ
ncbi:Type I restriction modification DNA specificity domain protein [Coleofasciculus chthonoplastes PCC 7420]|uniref:Type I restriction modification DNA specificity domain protein n=1 Tax=Coleofasciculus chthonoplastes PCC 7420 TaxID=118168 RepID=B4VXC6_9CYAN|nr:restriction endonuclease subunit S [Coleofasciculus chthonoplastes]EDX73396.1 Type I restriction modification DNA specificity domain protein [Coleofasciculus chthonoplastes PCC 7420]